MTPHRALWWALPAFALALACAGLPGREPVASEDERRAYAAALVPLGGLLVALPPEPATRYLDALLASGHQAAEIGEIDAGPAAILVL